MRIICAWCQREGFPGVLREEPPLPPASREADSHGICDAHALAMLEQLRRLLEPGALSGSVPRDVFSPGIAYGGRRSAHSVLGQSGGPITLKRTMAKILIADDHADSRELLTAVLASADHKVLPACDGVEAVEVYRQARPDLAILDAFMPNKDGIETLLELREEFPQAKIIVISAGWRAKYTYGLAQDVEEDVLDQAVALGADRAIQKPIEPLALLTAVDEVLTSPSRIRRSSA